MKKFCLAWLIASALLGSAWADDTPGAASSATLNKVLSGFAAKQLVMLYRQESATAPNRLDPTIQATTSALQHEFLDRHFKITQPSPAALAAMDRGPDVIVSFAPDAGMSMIYSVYSDVRPLGAPDLGMAEIRISAQVFIGSALLSTEEGRGELQTRTDAASAAYAVRRAYEIAAKDAASDLADRIEEQLKRLTPDDITQMVAADTTATTNFTVVTPGAATAAAPASAAPNTAASAAAPPDAPTIGKRWLVAVAVGDVSKVLGISGEGTTEHNLPGPAVDLKNIQSNLQQLGFDASSTVTLLDKAATTAAVTQALQHAQQVTQPNDEFVFYISGHGMQRPWATTGRTLPILYDTNVNDSQVFDFSRLAALISAIPARQIVVLIDTCHAGAATTKLDSIVISSRGVDAAKMGGAPELGVMMRGVKAVGDMAVLSAARADEEAIDRGPVIGGLFTSEFLKALKATHGTEPLQVVYTTYLLPNIIAYCAKDMLGCHQTPILGYDGSGNMIRIAGATKPGS
jgi:peptidoglycan hydrolase-like protein with peptidoglycan-binding domain